MNVGDADMVCTKCLTIVKSDARFCIACGKPLAQPRPTRYGEKLNARAQWGRPALPVRRPGARRKEPEHLFPWLKNAFLRALRAIPKHIAYLAVSSGIILAVNLLFWTIKPYFLPPWLQPFRGAISAIVFLTATYNDIIPKTIFWVIIFAFGRKLVLSMRRKGFGASFRCMKEIVPQLKAAVRRTGQKAWGYLTVGAGIGLVIANNFASYSRFSEARNKIDKYFVVLLIAFTVSYLLGEAKRTGLFRFVKLLTKDAAGLAQKNGLSDDGVYLVLSGFIAGLIVDLLLILVKFMYGGYILGAAAFIAGIILVLVLKQNAEVRR